MLMPKKIILPEVRVKLSETLTRQFENEINRLPYRSKDRQIVLDGFKDGVRTGISETCKMVAEVYSELTENE